MRNDWIIEYNGWKPAEHPLREALCTLGNGYIACRGAAEEVKGNEYNYPGTYLAGGYNRIKSKISGKIVENEDLVNWPNWLILTFKHKDGEWFNLEKNNVLEYKQCLDIRRGILERRMRFKDNSGRETSLISKRIVSMDDPHCAGIQWTLVPENWDGKIIIHSAIDGNITNNGVKRYRELNGNHIRVIEKGVIKKDSFYLVSITSQSGIEMTQAVSTNIYLNGTRLQTSRQSLTKRKYIGQNIPVNCKRSQPIRVEKLVSVFTSKDFAISDPATEAKKKIKKSGSFKALMGKSLRAWQHIWQRSDIKIESKHYDQLILRLHIFHLFQTISFNSIDRDIGVPSRGWHGEAYRGHIFWDELYIFPYLNLHVPQLSRCLLMYRYRRIREAREAALNKGYKGIMFPWQSGSNGREESQKIHLNPQSGRWIQDNTHLQRHINVAIPYNVWHYYQCTKDMEFLTYYGAELILGTALFWSSISEFNQEKDRYEIRRIIGPDEYHTSYPDAETPGINNNAYTNFMAVWVIQCALRVLDMFDENFKYEIAKKLDIHPEDIERWNEMNRKMYIPFNKDDPRIISQFDGFEDLKELDWDKYKTKYGSNIRLDRILEKENDTVNRYKAVKQADVIMLFYLFSSEEIVKIFKQLGYDFQPQSIAKNIEYYQKITSHGSTLSQVIHSWVFARSDRNRSWKSFQKALMSDFRDVQGGTTPEGIHLGAMAGTVDLIQRCYTGVEIRDDILWINPRLPENIKSLSLDLRYRSHWIKMTLIDRRLKIEFDKGWAEPVIIDVKGRKTKFCANDIKEFTL